MYKSGTPEYQLRELIEKTNTILDGVSRLKQEWERSKETIEALFIDSYEKEEI